jgi:hypothetical protein
MYWRNSSRPRTIFLELEAYYLGARLFCFQKFMQIIILDKAGTTLYGHDTLRRVAVNGKSEKVMLVEGIPLKTYLLFLAACFSDHQSVSRLHGNTQVTSAELERISESIEITHEHLGRLGAVLGSRAYHGHAQIFTWCVGPVLSKPRGDL